MATQAFPCTRERSRRPTGFGNIIIMYDAIVCRNGERYITITVANQPDLPVFLMCVEKLGKANHNIILYCNFMLLDHCHCFVGNSSCCMARNTSQLLNLECDSIITQQIYQIPNLLRQDRGTRMEH